MIDYVVPVWVQTIAISVSVCVCMSICLSACLSVCTLAYIKKPHVKISPNFLQTLPVAVSRSSSGDSAIRYVLRFCG